MFKIESPAQVVDHRGPNIPSVTDGKAARRIKGCALRWVCAVGEPGERRCLEAILVALRPTTEELLARINDVIDARITLVDVIAARIVTDVVLCESRLVRGGIKRQDVMGDGIEAVYRNNISRERLADCLAIYNNSRSRVVNRRVERAEISAELG